MGRGQSTEVSGEKSKGLKGIRGFLLDTMPQLKVDEFSLGPYYLVGCYVMDTKVESSDAHPC